MTDLAGPGECQLSLQENVFISGKIMKGDNKIMCVTEEFYEFNLKPKCTYPGKNHVKVTVKHALANFTHDFKIYLLYTIISIERKYNH